MPEHWCFELIKLLIQFLASFVAVWFAVFLALRRFKSERVWERRIQAYHEVTCSLADMIRDIDTSLAEIENGGAQSEAVAIRRSNPMVSPRAKLNEAMAIAHLLLPKSTCDVLRTLDEELCRAPESTCYEDHYYPRLAALKRASDQIQIHGRHLAGLKPLSFQ